MEVRSDGTMWVNNLPVKKANINGKGYEAGANTIPEELIKKVRTNDPLKLMTEGKEFILDNADTKHDLLNKLPQLNPVYKNRSDSLVAAAFSGTVVRVVEIMGTSTLVIIKNGDYSAAYSNLKRVNVTQGQQVKTGELLGVAAFNNHENKVAARFELYRNTEMITDKSEQEVIIRDLGQQRLNMRLKLGEVYAFKALKMEI